MNYTEVRVEHLSDKVIITAELESGQEITLTLNKADANFIYRELEIFRIVQEEQLNFGN